MKFHPTFFGVAIATVIVVALGVWFVNYSRWVPTRGTPTNATISQKLPESQPALSSVLVTPIAAHVSIAPSTNVVVFQPITTPTQVAEGSHVKTNATGRALVEGVNTTVVDSNTEIVLAALDTQKNQTRLQLEAGQIWSRVKKLTDKGEYYEIESQNVRASVRGTSFGFTSARVNNQSVVTLTVVDGLVRFGPVDPKTGEYLFGKDVFVPAGKKAVVTGSHAPIISNLTSLDKKDAWFIYNNSTTTLPPVQSSVPSAQTSTGLLIPGAAETVSPSVTDTSSSTTPTTQPSTGTTSGTGETAPVASPTVVAPTQNRTIAPATPDSPELLLLTISPNSIVAGTATTCTLTGSGFVRAGVSSVSIGDMNMRSFQVVDDTTIRVQIDAGQFVAGDYAVTIATPSNISSSLSPGLTVTRAPLR